MQCYNIAIVAKNKNVLHCNNAILQQGTHKVIPGMSIEETRRKRESGKSKFFSFHMPFCLVLESIYPDYFMLMKY